MGSDEPDRVEEIKNHMNIIKSALEDGKLSSDKRKDLNQDLVKYKKQLEKLEAEDMEPKKIAFSYKF